MKYSFACTIATILATATAIPIGQRDATGKRFVVHATDFTDVGPGLIGIGPETSATFGKRAPVYVGEYDDPRKQGLHIGQRDASDKRLVVDVSDLDRIASNPIGIGPQISSSFDKRTPVFVGEYDDPRKQGWWPGPREALDKRIVVDASAFKNWSPENVIGIGPQTSSVIEKRGDYVTVKTSDLVPEGNISPEGLGPEVFPGNNKFSWDEKREAEAFEVPWGTPSINPEGCDDPLLCAALKERSPKPEAEPEAFEVPWGTPSINPPNCNDPICAALKERSAEAEAEAEAEAFYVAQELEQVAACKSRGLDWPCLEVREAEPAPEPFVLLPGETAPAACTSGNPHILCL